MPTPAKMMARLRLEAWSAADRVSAPDSQASSSLQDAALAATFDGPVVPESTPNPRTIRFGGTENLFGYGEIKAFRAGRSPVGLSRSLSKTVITTYGRDVGIASTLFHRTGMSGKIGRQMQTWVRFPDGWHVVAAHVSLIDEKA